MAPRCAVTTNYITSERSALINIHVHFTEKHSHTQHGRILTHMQWMCTDRTHHVHKVLSITTSVIDVLLLLFTHWTHGLEHKMAILTQHSPPSPSVSLKWQHSLISHRYVCVFHLRRYTYSFDITIWTVRSNVLSIRRARETAGKNNTLHHAVISREVICAKRNQTPQAYSSLREQSMH